MDSGLVWILVWYGFWSGCHHHECIIGKLAWWNSFFSKLLATALNLYQRQEWTLYTRLLSWVDSSILASDPLESLTQSLSSICVVLTLSPHCVYSTSWMELGAIKREIMRWMKTSDACPPDHPWQSADHNLIS